MKIYALLGILTLLAAGGKWIEHGAVAKIEAHRLAEAAKVSTASLQNAIEQERVLSTRHASRETELQELIAQLSQKEEPTEQCPRDCKIVWPQLRQ